MRLSIMAALALAALVMACENVSTPEPAPETRGGPGFGAGMHAGRVAGR